MSKKRRNKKRYVPRPSRPPARREGVLHQSCIDAIQKGCAIVLTCDRCWAEIFDVEV